MKIYGLLAILGFFANVIWSIWSKSRDKSSELLEKLSDEMIELKSVIKHIDSHMVKKDELNYKIREELEYVERLRPKN